MRALFVAIVVVAAVGCGDGNSADYSSELSSEVPKPRANGPDFGAYKRTAPTPGGGAEAPKHLGKGQ